MDYYNEPSDISLPADGQNGDNIFPTVTFMGNVSINTSEAVGAIEDALSVVGQNLTEFAASETFEADLLTVFGESADVELGRTIIEGLAVGEGLPEITVVPVERMNGANGGYDSLTGEVYLADAVVASEPPSVIASETPPVIASEPPPVIASEAKQSLADVLTEELGHYIDSEVNEEDTTGDEGEHFAALVSGDELSEGDVEQLRGEDDTVEILDGLVEVEANQEVSFSNAINFDVENDPGAVAVADFNGDRISDLAVANRNDDSVSVLLGNGNGIFSKAVNFDVGDDPVSVAVGEFNGDGISDLAVANRYYGNLSVLLGKGDGSFSKAAEFDVGSRAQSVAVGEFNGDGISDLAVTNYDDVSILLGKGDGSFSKATNFNAGNGASVAVGEFNGDGISDLAVANDYPGSVSVLLGNGNGGFSNTNFDLEYGSESVAVGEFNGDGISDLAVANRNDDNLSVLLGNGDGSFSSATEFDVGSDSTSVALGEFNGDRILDVALANSDNVSVLLGNGDGSFSNPINFDAGSYPRSVAIGDFNSDRLPDLAVANRNDDSVSILLNTTPITITPNITVSNTKVTEGNKGRQNARFAVTLDNPSNETVRVNYATADQTAKAGKDYRKTNGILTFKPGQTRKTVNVPVFGDTLDEGNEKFQLNLSKPRNSKLGDRRGIATIRDNDKTSELSIGNARIVEGNRGRKNAKFAVTLDEASDETVRVNYATANGSAKAGKDYRKTDGTLTFKPGQTRKVVNVPVFGDTLDEGNEKFQLNLSKPRNAKFEDRRGIGIIRDNDKVVPQLSIGDARVTEGDDGRKQAKFTVTLNAKSKDTVRVNYVTGNGTADAGEDYRRTTGTLTFKPGQRRKTITVPVLGDIMDEKNEKFKVTLRKPRNAKLEDKTGIGTIRDND